MFKSDLIVKDKGFYKQFFNLTILLAMQNLLVFSVNLADSIMLGRFSEQALDGAALVNQIQFLLQMLVLGVAEAALIFGSRAWGRKDMETVRRITVISVKCALIVATTMAVLTFVWPHQILNLLTNETAVLANGVRYIKIVCFSYPLFAITRALLVALRSVEKVKTGFYVSVFALFTNIILNYILIFGKLGFRVMGIEGAAYATLISRVLEMLFVVWFVFLKDKTIMLKLKDFIKTDMQLFKAFLKKGTPVFLSNGMWGAAMFVQTSILGHMGQSSITANSIATTMFQILSVVIYGSASASAVIISKTIGENRKDCIKPYTVTLQLIYLVLGLATGATLYLLRNIVVGFYIISDDAQVLTLAFIAVLSVTVVGTAYEMSGLTGIVRGGGDTMFILKNDFIFMWFFVIPASALAAFYFHASPVFVFVLLKSDQILKCFVAAVKINRYTWIKKLDG